VCDFKIAHQRIFDITEYRWCAISKSHTSGYSIKRWSAIFIVNYSKLCLTILFRASHSSGTVETNSVTNDKADEAELEKEASDKKNEDISKSVIPDQDEEKVVDPTKATEDDAMEKPEAKNGSIRGDEEIGDVDNDNNDPIVGKEEEDSDTTDNSKSVIPDQEEEKVVDQTEATEDDAMKKPEENNASSGGDEEIGDVDNDNNDPLVGNEEEDSDTTDDEEVVEPKKANKDEAMEVEAKEASVGDEEEIKGVDNATVDKIVAEEKVLEDNPREPEPQTKSPADELEVGSIDEECPYTSNVFSKFFLKTWKCDTIKFKGAKDNIIVKPAKEILSLIVIVAEAFNSQRVQKVFEASLPAGKENEKSITLLNNGKEFAGLLDACFNPYNNVPMKTDVKENISSNNPSDQLFTAIILEEAKEALDLTGKENIKLDSKNVGQYMSTLNELRLSPLFLSLFLNMGIYKNKEGDPSSVAPCFFSQPSVNNRTLNHEVVDKLATGLYDAGGIFDFNEEFVVFPYFVQQEPPLDGGVDNIRSTVLPDDNPLESEDDLMAIWFDKMEYIDNLVDFFFDELLDDVFPKLSGEGIDDDSVNGVNHRFGLFLEQLYKKYNRFASVNDWKNLYEFMMTKIPLKDVISSLVDRRNLWITFYWHNCHILMGAISGARLSIVEGNHRQESFFAALFNKKVYRNLSENKLRANERTRIISVEALSKPEHKLRFSKMTKDATVIVTWPNVKKNKDKDRIGVHELELLKVFSALQQDKKSGSLERNIKDVLVSYLTLIKAMSTGIENSLSDSFEVHKPGSLKYDSFSLASMKEDGYELHQEAPNKKLILKDAIIQAAKEAKLPVPPTNDAKRKKKPNPKDPEKEAKSNAGGKYRNDDTSTGLDIRAMVNFREHTLRYILGDNCKEVAELKKSLYLLYCLHDDDLSKAFDPANENRPFKLKEAVTTPAILAQHIGYHWTVERSLHGCLFLKDLKHLTIRPSIWPIVFLVTNFVHDEVSLDLMIKVLRNNGKPSDTHAPFNVSTIENYPKLFSPAVKEYSNTIIYAFLKPQAMFYDMFLEKFKKLHTEVGEINIRNRYMLAIGKCWLKVIVKYGLWIETKDMNRCHKVLQVMMDAKAGDFEHFKTGSNVPQVAAYVCHLISVGVFELVGVDRSSCGDWSRKTGSFANVPPPDNWDVFIPTFKFGEKVTNQIPSASGFKMTIDQIVDYIFLGSFGESSKAKLGALVEPKLWGATNRPFTLECCKEWIEVNRKSVKKVVEESDDEDNEEDNTFQRSAGKFREKLFANTFFKGHMKSGDNVGSDGGTTISAGKIVNTDDKDLVCRRFDEMATALMEASLFLTFQKHLISADYRDDSKTSWKATEVMPVLFAQGAEKKRPFNNKRYTEDIFPEIEREGKVLAEACYKKAKSMRKKETSKRAVCVLASELAFKVSDKEYDKLRAIVSKEKADDEARKKWESEKRRKRKRDAEKEELDEGN
jgi:hypothetical protein